MDHLSSTTYKPVFVLRMKNCEVQALSTLHYSYNLASTTCPVRNVCGRCNITQTSEAVTKKQLRDFSISIIVILKMHNLVTLEKTAIEYFMLNEYLHAYEAKIVNI